MSARPTITQALQQLAGNACTGNCNQGRACTCGNRTPWATTSDPLAWVKVDTPAAPAPLQPQQNRQAEQAPQPCPLFAWPDLLLAITAVAALAGLLGIMSGRGV